MAKKSMVEREKKRIRLEKKYAAKRSNLLAEYHTEDSFEGKLKIHSKLQKLPRNSSKIRIRNLTENEVGTYYATGWSKSGGSTSSTGTIKMTSSPMQSPRSPAKPTNPKKEETKEPMRKESTRSQSEVRTEGKETKVEKTKEGKLIKTNI